MRRHFIGAAIGLAGLAPLAIAFGRRFSILIALALLSGCRHDDATPQGFTRGTLLILGEAICLTAPDECLAIRTLDEFLQECVSKGRISQKSDYEKDDWGRPMEWDVQKTGRGVVVRIISLGKNGVFEDGDGDDLYVEVVFREGLPPKQRLSIR